jgi:hypothetical protein
MKRYAIGIVTFHRALNFGAYWQATALSSALQKQLGAEINCDVRIADIYYPPLHWHHVKKTVLHRRLRRMAVQLQQWKRFVAARRSLPLCKSACGATAMQTAQRYLQREDFDLIICGSDEIWRVNAALPFPNFYWLPFALNAIKVSYAVSANRSREDLFTGCETHISQALNDFSLISVRDSYSAELVSRLGYRAKVQKHADPTVLLALPGSSVQGRGTARPRIGIMGLRPHLAQALKEALSAHCDVVGYGQYQSCFSKNHIPLDPRQWACLPVEFDCVVTDFFHATLFALKNRTPVVAVDSNPLYCNRTSKIKELLYSIELHDSYFHSAHPDFSVAAVSAAVHRRLTDRSTGNYEHYASCSRSAFTRYCSTLVDLLTSRGGNQ